MRCPAKIERNIIGFNKYKAQPFQHRERHQRIQHLLPLLSSSSKLLPRKSSQSRNFLCFDKKGGSWRMLHMEGQCYTGTFIKNGSWKKNKRQCLQTVFMIQGNQEIKLIYPICWVTGRLNSQPMLLFQCRYTSWPKARNSHLLGVSQCFPWLDHFDRV